MEMYRNEKEYLEIDFRRLGAMLLRRIWIPVLAAVLCGVLALSAGFLLVEPRYESSVLFCASNEPQGAELSASDLEASGKLVDGFSVILYSRRTLADVIAASGVSCSVEELERKITMEQIGQTQFFRVAVSWPKGDEAMKIAEAVASVFPQRVTEIARGTATVVDRPLRAAAPATPDLPLWTVMGAAMGVLLSAAILIAADLCDDTIRSPEDLERLTDLPLLVTVPENPAEAEETFRILRSKLCCDFEGAGQCRVIGVVGPGSGGKKTAAAAALARSLAGMKKKVLLLDCDLHSPALAETLDLETVPGLADYLEGRHALRNLFRQCRAGGTVFHVLTAGKPEEDPGELLCDVRMEGLLKAMGRIFDWIILDLPGAQHLADTMNLASNTDGILLVTEENRCRRFRLEETVSQLKAVNSRILGSVYYRNTINRKLRDHADKREARILR